jgi:hypothetical protein
MPEKIDHLWAEALFVSTLQRSEEPTPDQVWDEIARTIGRYGSHGCAEQVALEFGEHPEVAVARMSWALHLLAGCTGAAARIPVCATTGR